MMQLSKELLRYSSTPDRQYIEEELSIESFDNKTTQAKRVVALAHSVKQDRLKFYNSTDGVALSLFMSGNDHEQGVLTCFAFCGQHTEG